MHVRCRMYIHTQIPSDGTEVLLGPGVMVLPRIELFGRIVCARSGYQHQILRYVGNAPNFLCSITGRVCEVACAQCGSHLPHPRVADASNYCDALFHPSLYHEYSYNTSRRVGNIFDINRWRTSYIIDLYIHSSTTTTCLTRLRRSPHTPKHASQPATCDAVFCATTTHGPINEPATPRPGCSVCSVRHLARPWASLELVCRGGELTTVDLGCKPRCDVRTAGDARVLDPLYALILRAIL
jgi:hypothetical protein